MQMFSSSSNLDFENHTDELQMTIPGPMLMTIFFIAFLVINCSIRRLFSSSAQKHKIIKPHPHELNIHVDARDEFSGRATKVSKTNIITEQQPRQFRKLNDSNRFGLGTIINPSVGQPPWISPWINDSSTDKPNSTCSHERIAHRVRDCEDQHVDLSDGGSTSSTISS